MLDQIRNVHPYIAPASHTLNLESRRRTQIKFPGNTGVSNPTNRRRALNALVLDASMRSQEVAIKLHTISSHEATSDELFSSRPIHILLMIF